MKRLIALLFLAALPCGAFAYFDGGVGTIGGSHGYSGVNGFAELGTESGFSLRPSFNTYKNDFSGGTFATYAGRVGYDQAAWGVGVEGGVTPKVNGYKNSFFSGDVTFSLTPSGGAKSRLAGPRTGGGAKGDGLARVDVGGSLARISHSSDLDSSGGTLADAFKVDETDLSVFAGAMFLKTQLSARYMKNLDYSKTLTAADREPMKVDLPGYLTSTQGFMNQSWNLRADWTMFPMVSPYFSYTYTQYKLARPSAKAYVMGASVGLNMLNLNVAYQIYDPGEGFDTENFVSVGAGLKF